MKVEYIVLHCTAGEWGNVASLRAFHTAPPPAGRGWLDVGYHYVVTNAYPSFEGFRERRPAIAFDGVVHPGRDLDHDGNPDNDPGAHVQGWNDRSLGVAMVGKDVFSALQLRAAASHCLELAHRHEVPIARIIGHYETGAPKTCPNLEMNWFRELVRSLA